LDTSKSKQKIIQFAFLISAFILLSKAAQIQLFDSSYKTKALQTTLDKKLIYPSRGMIFDRNGKLLVINNPIYDLKVVYNKVDPNMDTTKFCSLLDITKETFNKNIIKDWSSPMFSKRNPFNFLNKISPEQYAKFQEHLFEFPGFFPVMRNIRGYPHKSAPHVLGYIGEVNRKDIDQSEGIYSLGDYIGINGIEKQYEEELRGSKGISYVLKDNLGREVETLDQGKLHSSAVSGRDIISTIDLDIQSYGEFLLQNKKGSIVAIEPKTGEILTMVSSPSFDPNLLSVNKNRGDAFQSLLRDTISNPMLDRSIMAKYPPGSIFKPILALIALQEGVTYLSRTIYCDEGYTYRGFTQGCHAHPTPWNIQMAIQHSCNAYFLQLCRDVLEVKGFNNPAEGLKILRQHLYDFGLGRKLGVDNMHENKGFVPTNEFYNKLYDKTIAPNGWRSTYIMSLGIGQGELELTTLQMANLAAIIANRGFYYTPH
jgi:penicillin-binding protein 2